MKMSYEAFMKNFTITELMLRKIISSFKFLRDSGQIHVSSICTAEEEDLFKQIIRGEIIFCLKMLIKHNISKQFNTIQPHLACDFSRKMKKLLISNPLEDKKKFDRELIRDKKKFEWHIQDIINDRIIKIRDRSKCFDLFWDLKIGKDRMYKWRPIKDLV